MAPKGNWSGRPSNALLSNVALLNAVHDAYLHAEPYPLDAKTSIVVNTWRESNRKAPTIDSSLAARAWEHARRRIEDNCVLLPSLHPSAPTVFIPFLETLPFVIPSSIFTCLQALQPFLCCMTPLNPSTPRYAALSLKLSVDLQGQALDAKLALPADGIDLVKGLLGIPMETGYRAFNVFYYLLASSSTPTEREFLHLKHASDYLLLSRSRTYYTPDTLPTINDDASADDFRQLLQRMGIKGSVRRNLLSTLAGILTLGNTLEYTGPSEELSDVYGEAGELLDIDPDILITQSNAQRRAFISQLYQSIVQWMVSKANELIRLELRSDNGRLGLEHGQTIGIVDEGTDSTVSITVIDMPDPSFGRAVGMQSIFDQSFGINSEISDDGIEIEPIETNVAKDMRKAMAQSAFYQSIMSSREDKVMDQDEEDTFERIALSADDDSFMKNILTYRDMQAAGGDGAEPEEFLSHFTSSRLWYLLSLYPGSEGGIPDQGSELASSAPHWSASQVTTQLLEWRLRDWANQRFRHLGFTADFDLDEFLERYSIIGCQGPESQISEWSAAIGWGSREILFGHSRLWLSEEAWWHLEKLRDNTIAAMRTRTFSSIHSQSDMAYVQRPQSMSYSVGLGLNESSDHLLRADPAAGLSKQPTATSYQGKAGFEPRQTIASVEDLSPVDTKLKRLSDPELGNKTVVEVEPTTRSRRLWVGFVWAMTFWIPSFLLTHIGRMKRPDVRQAWREKVVLVFIILFLNALILFWMIGLGNLLCPNYDKAWTRKEVSTHQGEDDFWVSIHGGVYDISDFWRRQHSDTAIETTTANMQPLAGFDMDEYFVPPLYMACKGLGIAKTTALTANTTPEYSTAVHTSGQAALYPQSALKKDDWYWTHFEPSIKEYYHGNLVYSEGDFKDQARRQRMWARYGERIYDLTNYFYTKGLHKGDAQYEFLDKEILDLWQDNLGKDIQTDYEALIKDSANNKTRLDSITASWDCIQAISFKGILDFRETAKCQVNSALLLAFTVIVCTIIVTKFLAAVRFGSKRIPVQQDKFVICQVPAYSEGEESLRKAINSLTNLKYDNRRKLLCIICDGLVVGQGNDRTTPKIILELLGVDQTYDPPAHAFKSIGTGSAQLNYGKVYSGLYEHEGNIVPYIVIVKVGKESEQSRTKPGNRGKRDSQMVLMSFLNRVHHNAPMNPLELELFHHINTIIGVDPQLYEFLLMVDADTCVDEDALNHLVAACTENTKIAGICGETTLANDQRSWWTMIQIYEYFISHHLAKAFESLFGSVTCLPGCFTMYRLKTYDGRKPLIVSDAVIQDYSICDVETLHMKNLLSLGEDRYLTTLMMKHFPRMWLKFLPEAKCQTAAPESWSVLLSQRRRWINSTIHNLAELMRLENMCGFCFFGMRAVVFADLFGTIIFPATCVYLGYLFYRLGTKSGPFPTISIALLAGSYGLQALLFLFRADWQHIGWMIIYIMALPLYSFVLPLYSFWNQDNFTWGNTRVVIGEKGNKQVVAIDDEEVFDPSLIPLHHWVDYPSRYTPSPIPNRNHAQSALSGSITTPKLNLQSRAPTALGHRSSVGVFRDQLTEFRGRETPDAFLDPSGRDSFTQEIIRNSVRSLLEEINLDTVTKGQIRAILEQRLHTSLTGEELEIFNQELDSQLQRI
ncbi:unnamed protein product [Clonostachys rhizophaga]|uniref:chitin synthase n=1 Tax=Clonostachys rhizophaga TaxID=160324 RepID=A0A9N9VWX5_9HYPO|nr:unnamed protein product [Clonostachys rhizophaga]